VLQFNALSRRIGNKCSIDLGLALTMGLAVLWSSSLGEYPLRGKRFGPPHNGDGELVEISGASMLFESARASVSSAPQAA
jgi:hypothetical protein